MKNLVAYLLLLHISFLSFAQTRTISFSSDHIKRINTPVRIPISIEDKKLFDTSKQYEISTKNGKKTIGQFISEGNELIFLMPEELQANSKTEFTIKPTTTVKKTIVTINENAGLITIASNNKPVFTYHTEIVHPPADSPDYYKRSGFIHPLYSPNGEILTDDFPAGHVHQHALFAAWTNTTFKNSFVDFWNQHQKKGTVEHVKVLNKLQGPVCAQLDVLLRYRSLEHGEVLLEKWRITVYPFSEYFVFDIESEQTNTTNDTLYLNKYHYGGMAFRGSKYWNPDDKKNYKNNWNILTSEGIKDSAANHTHASWVDASGMLEKKMAGVTIIGSTSNFRYPQAIRVHPQMPYWVYAPMVDGPFTIEPGKKYYGKFRYWVHHNGPDLQAINKWKEDFTEKIIVRIQ